MIEYPFQINYKWGCKTAIIISIILACSATYKTFAQSPTFLQHGNIWLGYTLRKPIAKKFSWNSDLQLRFRNNKAFYDYTLIRTGLQYELNKDFSTSAGLLYGQDNYEGKSLPTWKNEKRVWQECRYFFGKLTALQVMLQFRLEERWFVTETVDEDEESRFAWRFRHRIDLRKSFKENWRLSIGDEIMFQNSRGKSTLNQNRVWCGISRVLSHRNEVSAQLMLISWKAPDATVLRLNFLHQL
ncbi:hypothetical protein BH10BAC3_BH10BAC3_13980 [soil metagenome]